MKKMKKKNFMPFMYFMVKKNNNQRPKTASGANNAITVSYLLLHRDSKKMGDRQHKNNLVFNKYVK